MTNISDFDQVQQLQALVGKWHTKGYTRPTADTPVAEIDATDEYDRLPGGALLHLVDARVGDQKVEGAEIIGFDPHRQSYVTLYYGTDGPNSYEARFEQENGALVWKMASARDRFTGIFSKDGNTITGHWELIDQAGNWQPWMDVTLTK